MTKRILLSVLLVLSMVIVFAPSAFAASPAVAKVGSVEYATVEEAIDAANGETITLLTPIVVEAGETKTLDLKGQTIVGSPETAAAYAVITNRGTLTITGNGTIMCKSSFAGSTGYALNTIVNSGNLTIDGATIENKFEGSGAQIGYAIDNNSTSYDAILTVKAGKVTASGSVYFDSIRQFANSTTKQNSVTVLGGEIGSIWMQNPSDGTADRNTKDVKASLTISGGDIGAVYTEPSTSFEAAITGGNIGSVAYHETDDGRDLEGFISGGTFGSDVSDFCADGFNCKDNGSGVFGVEESLIMIGTKYYSTIAEAIAAAQDGDVITLLAGEIDETVSVAKINKTITIKGADNFGTTLTGGIRLGTDNNTADSGKVTIDGIVFSGKGLALVELAEATVTNNKFTNITDKSAILVLCDNLTDKVIVSGNEIDTTAEAGIRVRTPKALTITDNKVKNTAHNSITVEHGGTYPANTGAIVITGNTLENWGTSGEGRALRLAMGSGDAEKDVTFERNVMIHTDAPEEFAKITDAPEATVSVDENYWGGMDPHDAGFVAPEVPANYYTNTSLTALAVFRAKLGDIYFVNVADAIAAAGEGDIVEMIVSVPEDDFVLAVGVGLKSSAAIDAYISAPRDYVIERTYTAGGYLYTVAGTVFGVDLTPKSYTLLAGNSVQFFATVSGTTDETGVIWRLEGDHKYSYITRNGVLVASLADKTCNVTVTAISAYDTTKSASVTITIYNPFADANGRFSDVKTSAWYYDSVEYVYNEGLMLGTSETQFSPNMTVSRAMIVTILWRLEGSPVVTDDVAFPDLKDGEWYTDAAKWAAANKLVLGYDNGNFGAEDDITHEQILALFNRYADYKNLKSESASNANVYYTYSDWAKDNVMWGAANGLFDRMNSDAVSLANAANRAEIAAYLAQFCRNIIK